MSFIRKILGLNKWIRVLLFLILLWGVIVFVFIIKLHTPTVSEFSDENTLKRLNQAITFLEQSKQRNTDIKQLIDELVDSKKSYRPDQKNKIIENIEQRLIESNNNNEYSHKIDETNEDGDVVGLKMNQVLPGGGGGGRNFEPSLEYEQLRRRLGSNTQELWNYIQSELTKIKKYVQTPNSDDVQTALKSIQNQLDHVLDDVTEHKNSLLSDWERLQEIDGYNNWRYKESAMLSSLIQKRLYALQNPPNCSKARKLICRLNKGCGYGCQLHHVVYCFIMAYATERTLILKSRGWRYHKGGWDEVFLPLSQNCLDAEGQSHATWPGHYNTQVIELPIIDSLNPRPTFLPLAIPEDIAPRLKRLHGDPIVWWVGQFLKYLLRPQSHTKEMLETGRDRLGFKRPIVGVHVRRTDKVGTEAALHGIDEYMYYVNEYFNQLEVKQPIEKRTVFVASDDPKVIEEARQNYPSYDIIGDQNVARMAAVSTRYTDSSLNGIILDIYMLSICDYLVCTFSSQVCRVAYEIMQTMYPDASTRFKSLDDIYYYGGQNAHNRIAVQAHHPKNQDEIQMQVGDLIGVAGNHWNGYSKGKNTRTNQVGLFPSYKVIDKVETADFPKYSHIKETNNLDEEM